jgi:hypothetical protein
MGQPKELYFAARCPGCGWLLPITPKDKYWVLSHQPYIHYEVMRPRCDTRFIRTDPELIPAIRPSTSDIGASLDPSFADRSAGRSGNY